MRWRAIAACSVSFFSSFFLLACGDDAGPVDAAAGDGGVPTADAGPAFEEVTVDTASGPVVGRTVLADGVTVFRGIPFAAPPVGDAGRFRAPRPVAPWTDPLTAFSSGPACPQQDERLIDRDLGMDEDCLRLNVWRPADPTATDLPVVVWIHGGAFLTGSANLALYDQTPLAQRGVVAVSMNYRVGLLGFLAHADLAAADEPVGNWGLMDQLAALRWVRDEVAAFGGDPSRVTIYGESAGGMSVCALMAMREADGLYHGAIMQSGSCLSEHQVRDRDDGATLARAFSAAIGCEGVGDVAGCLRGASVLDVLRAEEGSLINFDQRGRPGPVVDGVLLPTTPRAAVAAGTMPDVPFLFGTNADEGSILVQGANVDTAEEYDRTLTQLGGGPARLAELSALYPPSDYGGDRTAAATRAVTDILFSCPSRRTARDWVGAGGRAWVYQFTHHTLLGEAGLGAFHGSELFVLFRDGMLRPEDDALSQRMLGYWTQHAVAGSPGSVEGVDWPAFEATTEPFLELGTPVAVRAGWPGAARCDALDTIFGTGL